MENYNIRTIQDLQTAVPSYFFTSECERLAPVFHEMDEDTRAKAWDVLKERLASSGVQLEIPDSSKRALLIMAVTRCTAMLKEPSIGNIAELGGLNRNAMAEFARGLEFAGLLERARTGRSERLRLTRVGELYADLAFGKTHLSRLYIDKVLGELRRGAVARETIEKLETVEFAFDLVKNTYPKNTLNYEIQDALHDRLIQLIAAARSGKADEARDLAKELKESLEAMEESMREIEARGLKPVILEDTGERIGRGRVFRPTRKK